MKKKMETTIMGLYRVYSGFRGSGVYGFEGLFWGCRVFWVWRLGV